MKRLLLSLVGVFAGLSLSFAQTTLYTNEFLEDTGLDGWEVENLGTSPEVWYTRTTTSDLFTTGQTGFLIAYGYNSTAGTTHDGNTRATSPAFSTIGTENVYMTFEHLFEFQVANNAIGIIEVSNDSTNWVEVARITSPSEGVIDYKVDLGETAIDQEKVYIRLTYISEGDFYWALDDLEIYEPSPGNNITVTNLNLADYEEFTSSPFTQSIDVFNNGTEIITEVEVSISINGGASTTETISGLNIGKLTPGSINLSNLETPSEGFYSVDVAVNEVNGDIDVDINDNSVNAGLIAYNSDNAEERIPFYEVFTSSSCAPCRPGNEVFEGIVTNLDDDSYVSIKYQQNFPGTGDPYTSFESVDRRAYYGVNAIPNMHANGGWNQNAQSFNLSLHNQFSSVPAVLDITGEYDVNEDEQSVSYNFDITSVMDIPENAATLYVAILEKQTFDNATTNGETSFEHVFKKMIPGLEGQPITELKSGEATNISGTYVFQGDYVLPVPAGGSTDWYVDHETEHTVEGFDDLLVIAWVQNDESKVVLQANNLSPMGSGTGIFDLAPANVSDLSVYPNPTQNDFLVSFDMPTNSEVLVNIINMDGKVVGSRIITAAAGNINIEFDSSELANGNYLVQILSEGAQVASTKLVVNH